MAAPGERAKLPACCKLYIPLRWGQAPLERVIERRAVGLPWQWNAFEENALIAQVVVTSRSEKDRYQISLSEKTVCQNEVIAIKKINQKIQAADPIVTKAAFPCISFVLSLFLFILFFISFLILGLSPSRLCVLYGGPFPPFILCFLWPIDRLPTCHFFEGEEEEEGDEEDRDSSIEDDALLPSEKYRDQTAS